MPRRPRYRPPWDHLYKTARWRHMRAAQLRRHPLCAMCARVGLVRAATVADHVRPHKGDTALFFDSVNLQSLCAPHHNGTKQSHEKADIPIVGVDGWPIDPVDSGGGQAEGRVPPSSPGGATGGTRRH